MKEIKSKDLKTILHSKRAQMYYLEHCRVLVNGGRVEYVTDEGKRSSYWNIPIANTTYILLGNGTSITQAAMRELSKAGVLIGFCGGGGTPLFNSLEHSLDIAWITPQSEYRPTEYLQQWVSFWFNESKRLEAAKHLQHIRLRRLESIWLKSRTLKANGFCISSELLQPILCEVACSIQQSTSICELLSVEAHLTKKLFKIAARTMKYGEFTREKKGQGSDPANQFLDHGNYLAYGLGATATWVLGLPHGLAVLHGKTRRGGLVFDAADLIKDSIILPQAFISAMQGDDEQVFRKSCLKRFAETESLHFMIDSLKNIAAKGSI